MFNKILVAIDRSTASRDVFETAVSLAKTTGASLMLLHVLANEEKQDPTLFVYSGIRYNVMSESLEKQQQQESMLNLPNFVAILDVILLTDK